MNKVGKGWYMVRVGNELAFEIGENTLRKKEASIHLSS